MKEFMHDNIYGREYEIRYGDIDANHELKAVSVLNYLEDAALAHSAYMGYPLRRYLEEGNVWVLTSWAMEMERYPKYDETLTVETWASEFGRFRATRNFRLTNGEGGILGGISSQWIFFDLKQRRPAKTTDEMKRHFGTNQTCALPYEPEKLAYDGSAMEQTGMIEVRRSDIDSLGHVNNKRFIEWMSETVPQDVYGKKKIFRMEINYLKEVYLGSTVTTACKSIENNNSESVFFHLIRGISESNGQIDHASGKTYWR